MALVASLTWTPYWTPPTTQRPSNTTLKRFVRYQSSLLKLRRSTMMLTRPSTRSRSTLRTSRRRSGPSINKKSRPRDPSSRSTHVFSNSRMLSMSQPPELTKSAWSRLLTTICSAGWIKTLSRLELNQANKTSPSNPRKASSPMSFKSTD